MLFLVLAGLCRETDAFAELLQLARTDVGRHDDNGILEIYGPSQTIRQPAFVHHLQQHVEHVGVSLLDFIQQHDRVGMTAYFFCQLSAFLVTHVSRGSSDQT